MARASRGPRDLSRAAMLEAALEVMEAVGETGFSLRRVAGVVGCDPMSVSYHFGSREGLERAMALTLDEQVRPPVPTEGWRVRLRHVADEYRRVALARPRTFVLLQRFTHSGPADHALTETVHRALRDAGVAHERLAAVTLGWYATVIGLAVAEVSGLVAAVDDAEADELLALPEDDFALTRSLVPSYRSLDAAEVFAATVEALHDGIATLDDA